MSVQGQPEFIGALIEPDATAAFHAVEFDFGSALAPNTNPTYVATQSESSLSWTEELRGGPPIVMQVSLDDARTWQTQINGAPIAGTLAGDVVAGRYLRLRQLFRGDANNAPILTSITWSMEFVN